MIKFLKIFMLILIPLFLWLGIWWFLPERTPRIKGSETRTVSQIDYITLGEVEQCVLIRSENINNPILLFLHGGPGMPMMYMAHEFQRPLEEDFTVVQWDRRGAGKTIARNKPTVESMNVRQVLDDGFALIDTLMRRYHQDQIVLIGHSFGTYLGSIMVNERPELFSAYVSVGQVVDDEKSRLLQEKFIRKQAILNERQEIIEALNDSLYVDLENWLFEFGGELKRSKSFFPFIWSGLQAPEYTLPEVSSVAKGSSFSSANMKYNVLSANINDEIREYLVPVYFFVGRSDYVTPSELVTDYYNLIKAPKKEIIYFENSSHFPFFEEPEKFCLEIKKMIP